MFITGYKKVHVVMPGLEVIRVIKPLKHIGCEKLIIIGKPSKNKKDQKLYHQYNTEIKRQLKGYLKPNCIEEVDVDVYNIEDIISNLCRSIKVEQEKKNTVFVNVSCGSKIFVAAAVMASMMYGAVPYFAKRKGFRTKPKDLMEQGRPAGIAIDAEEPIELPTFYLKPPEPEMIKVLAAIDSFSGQVVRQGDIIKKLETIGLMKNVYEVEKTSEKRKTVMGKKKITRRALNEFKTRFFNRLIGEEWIETSGAGRRVEVKLTQKGRQRLRIFRHLALS